MTDLQKQHPATVNLLVSLGLFVLAILLATFNHDFSIAFHADEWKKALFVVTNEQDFHHPILLLQLSRILDIFAQSADKSEAVMLGRWVSAVMLGVIAVSIFHLAKKMVHTNWAMLVAVIVVASPSMVVHAHYMKEDILQTACLYLSLWQFFRLVEIPDRRNTLLLGLFTGLALSSHYKSVMLAPVLGVAPFLIGIKQSWKLYPKLLAAAGVSLVVFVLVNYPMLLDFDNFIAGFEHERTHALRGHAIKVYPVAHLFSFHIRHSIIPGLTLPVALLSGLGIGHVIIRWKSTGWKEQLLLVYTVVFYLVVEISPTKPYPDFMRYVIPILPALVYFAVKGFRLIVGMFPIYQKWVIAVFTIGLLSFPIYVMGNLLNQMKTEEDPRYKADVWVQEHEEVKVLFGYYASLHGEYADVANPGLIEGYQKEGYTHLIYSSYSYQRFLDALKWRNQDELTYIKGERFQYIFNTYPYIEIKAPYKSYAFSGPTIRIVDIRKDKKKRVLEIPFLKYQ